MALRSLEGHALFLREGFQMFEGFSGSTVDFLWGIRFNNEKSWFEAHKEDYRTHVQRPMKELAQTVYTAFLDRHPDLDLVCKVSRIHRDARRLFGRGPYKDHLWFSLVRPHIESGSEPVFWFELTPEEWSCGMGFWQAPPLTMAKFRARMDRDPKPVELLARRFAKQEIFVLEGEDYKRPKPAPSFVLAPWYIKKSFALSHSAPHEAVLWESTLADKLLDAYEFLLPYYQLILSLSGDPDPRQ